MPQRITSLGYVLAALLGAAVIASASATGATTFVVSATVASATSLDATQCASGTTGRTDLGSVLPGTSLVSSADCTVTFGSSNSAASLRLQQSDGYGNAMWRPTGGSLDTGFDTDGRVTVATAPTTGFDGGSAVAAQGDGRIVTIGACALGGPTGQDFCLARFNVDGSLDTSFDADGRVTTATAPFTGNDTARDLVVQPDGKVVAVGYCDMGATGPDICVVRYLADGTLDTTFDTDGRVTTSIAPGTGYDRANGVALTPDGRIVTAGRCDMGGATGVDFCLARYLPGGLLDASFGVGGVVVTATSPATGTDGAEGVVLQPDGKIVAAGSCAMGGSTGTDACIARYDFEWDPRHHLRHRRARHHCHGARHGC